ncbi:MAG: hypothetical protein K5756_06720 [Clostridiales bacterium]|nr:hypothetical protein [Clostridiales bacterium]
MKKINKIISVVLAALMMLSLTCTVFAEEEIPPIESLDTSAVNGKLTAYKGVETYFVIYPQPEEAEPRFDVRNAVITCSKEGIVKAEAYKNEEYRFGAVNITGLKLGSTVVTVTDPDSGISCSIKVTVFPGVFYRIKNIASFIDYIPYYVFFWILKVLGKYPVK